MSPPGQRAETRYRLKLAVKEGQSFVSSLPRRKLDAVNYSRPVERWRYKLSASFSLHDLQTSGLATKGSSQSVVAYDVVREPIADLQARDAAMSRAAIELGQDIRLRLAAFLAR